MKLDYFDKDGEFKALVYKIKREYCYRSSNTDEYIFRFFCGNEVVHSFVAMEYLHYKRGADFYVAGLDMAVKQLKEYKKGTKIEVDITW
jgi:hypothetical protein